MDKIEKIEEFYKREFKLLFGFYFFVIGSLFKFARYFKANSHG